MSSFILSRSKFTASCAKLVLSLYVFTALFSAPKVSHAQVMLQGFYWDVPSPAAGKPNAPWWWDVLAMKAKSLRQAGFTAIWIPPALKANSGGYSVGYDPFDDYDLGSKNQKKTVPTRYGTRDQLQRAVAMIRANGLDVYLDLVQNHRNGDDGNFNFRYNDAYGNQGFGRFAKSANDFHPTVQQDPKVPLGNMEYTFGRDVAHVNGGGGYVGRGMMNAGDWITRSLDAQGYRLDYVKGISSDWLLDFLNYGAMKNKFAVVEFYDGNLNLLRPYVQNDLKNRAAAFDFPLRGTLKEMCDKGGSFDMKRLVHAGLAGIAPKHAVTFVENHDTDRDSAIVRGKMLAYAYILTSEGYPSVFYRDYMEDANCYKLKRHLDPLIFINRRLAAGATKVLWSDEEVYVFERTGAAGLLVGLSDQTTPQTVRVQTGFGKRTRLVDYTGHAPAVTTDETGSVAITIPANKDGDSYVCYAPAGMSRNLPYTPKRVNQEFFGAADLDIKPAESGVWNTVGRIYPKALSTLSLALSFDAKGQNADAAFQVSVTSSVSRNVYSRVFKRGDIKNGSLKFLAQDSVWHTIRIREVSKLSKRRVNYRLTANYLAPETGKFD